MKLTLLYWGGTADAYVAGVRWVVTENTDLCHRCWSQSNDRQWRRSVLLTMSSHSRSCDIYHYTMNVLLIADHLLVSSKDTDRTNTVYSLDRFLLYLYIQDLHR